MDEKDRQDIDKKRALIFLGLVFVITYLYEFIAVTAYLRNHPGQNIAMISGRVAIAMFIPAVCVILTRIITKEGFSDLKIRFGLKEGRYRYYLLAWFIPAVLIILGTLLYFAVFSGDFSKDMKFAMDNAAGQGMVITPGEFRKNVLSTAIAGIFLGPIVNCITCFGEEWGWRGYLLHKLKGLFKPYQLMLIMGVIWGLWHLPLTIAGHNYGMDYLGYPVLGVLAMIIFCFSIGTLFSYMTLKTDSCIPSVIGHGAFNALSFVGIYFTEDGGKMLFGPAPCGLISVIPALIIAIILIILMNRDEEIQK